MSETRAPRRLLRSAGALLAGLILIVAFSIATDGVMHATGVYSPEGKPMSDGRWLLATTYRIIYGIAGCYLTAWLAPARPLRHAMVLGGIGAAAGFLGVVMTWNAGPDFGPRWYPLAVFAIQLPCAWIGAELHRRRAVRPSAG